MTSAAIVVQRPGCRVVASGILALALSVTIAAASLAQMAPPKRIRHVEPEYPATAREARIQGVVSVEATIGADGKVRDARIVKSVLHLDEAALAAVRQWEFEPTLVNGVATPIVMTVQVAFSLSDPADAAPPASAPAPSRATQKPPAGGVPNSTPASRAAQASAKPSAGEREWEKLAPTVGRLVLDDKISDAIGLVEKFLARYPAVAAAHMGVADLYDLLAGVGTPETAEQRVALESAARHYARASETLTARDAELVSLADIRFMLTVKLARLYSADRLDDPAQHERLARRLVEEHPTRAESHVYYGRLLHERGDLAAAADVMRRGRALSQFPPEGLLFLMQYATDLVQQSPDLSAEQVSTWLDEANNAADTLLGGVKEGDPEYRLVTFFKATVYELRAERLERDRQRRIALLAEAERWSAPIAEHKGGAPPPPRKLTAADADDLEWQYLRRWYSRPAEKERLDESIALFENYVRENPDAAAAHIEIAFLSQRGADSADDEQRRRAYQTRAATHWQRAFDLATENEALETAFVQLLYLYAPDALDVPSQQESASRTMITRAPAAPRGYYRLAAVLLRTGRSAEAEKTMRAARAAIRATSTSRADMAADLLSAIRADRALSVDAGRRLFKEAGALLDEAEKLNANDARVLEARAGWLLLDAERFERDPARAAQLREQSKRLLDRAAAIREKTQK